MQSKNGGFLFLVEYTGMVVLWLLRNKQARQEKRSAETRRLALGGVIIGFITGILVTALTNVNNWIVLPIIPLTPIAVFLLRAVREKLEEVSN